MPFKIHELKTIQPYFDFVNTSIKRFEVRKNDRNFQEGDFLLLKEYTPKSDTYSGKEILCRVLYILDKGKKTGLPKTILEFPVFNQNIYVYNIKLLGDLKVTRYQHDTRIKLSPQESAILIHLALRAGAPGKSTLLGDLNANFWAQSKKPASRLAHTLVKIRSNLRIPSHLLSVVTRQGQPRLINRGLYLTTDYQEVETLLTQIQALEKANEWQYAKRDYLRVFKLIRGEPFRKMYDPWSEQARGVIFNRIHQAAKDFTEGCRDHGSKKDAKRVLERLATALPHSVETKKLQSEL